MNVPKLRFGEFADEWDIKLINDITSKVGSGSTPSGGASVYVDKGVLFIRSQNINNDQLIFDDATYISQSIHDKMKGSTVQANDVLLNITGASIGRSCVVPESFIEGNVNQHVSIIRFLDGYVPRFYQKYLSSERGQRHISSLQVGGGREGLNFQAIRKIAIPCPDTNEQQKIADFLSAVDDKITALTAQKTALTQYKQGMMQRIFSQTLRFKDDNGADYPEWDRTSLSQLGTTYGGLTGKTKEDFGIGKPFITYKQVFDDSKIDISRFEHVQISKDETQNRVKRGDIIFTTSSETANEIAFSSVLLDEFDELYLNSFCFGYRPNSLETFLPEYARYLFRSEFLRKEIIMLAQGSTRYNISKNQLMKLHIPLPSMPEQTKIAQFLTECDNKINAVDAQILSAQQWKQGLLQQMFV